MTNRGTGTQHLLDWFLSFSSVTKLKKTIFALKTSCRCALQEKRTNDIVWSSMAKDSLVARVSFSSEDSSSLCAGDLGLGFGLKPGGLPKSDLTSPQFREPLSFLADLQSPVIEQLESNEVAEDYEGKHKNSNWRSSLEERVEQFKERTGFSGYSRISSFMISLPKRSFSFASRNRKTTEIATHNSGTSRKESVRELKRENSVGGNLNY